jgi:peptide/nickel transport system permease protein
LPQYGRISRGETLTIKQREYVQAAVAMGYPDWQILLRHVLPNILPPILVVATLLAASMALAESALSFLGVGVQPPTPSWGSMIDEGRAALRSHPYIALFPGLMLTLTALAFNYIGDGLRDAYDVKIS